MWTYATGLVVLLWAVAWAAQAQPIHKRLVRLGAGVGLPLALAILSLFFFFATPLTNSVVRQAEAEADAYGLNSAQEPNGFAMAAMRLSTYRKINPGPLEEIIFYDHPSGYARVHRSMVWLQEHQDNPTANLRSAAP